MLYIQTHLDECLVCCIPILRHFRCICLVYYVHAAFPEYMRFLTYNYHSHGTWYMTPSHSMDGSFSELFV